MNAAEKALATFRTPPHNHTCPQAICAAFGHEEMLEEVRAMGAGRAPGGLCGSLYAACLLAPGHAEEIKAEFQAANGAIRCAGLMLYAGIRPHEVARLTWAQIDLKNKTIAIEARHSKTGGSRQVTIYPPLKRLLKRHQRPAARHICPRGWTKRWSGLHRRIPFRWVQDILRHTYATYHLQQFRDYTALQYEIGHRSTRLLRTRYVNFNGLTRHIPLF